jgi:hypothetical protein
MCKEYVLDTNVFIIAVLAIIGIGMVIAGIKDMSSVDAPKDGPAEKPNKTTVTGWMLGSSDGMDPQRAGRARITIGIIFIIGALLYAGVKFLDN